MRHPTDEAVRYLCEASKERRAFRDHYMVPALVDGWRNYVVREDRFNRYAEMTSHGPSHTENVATLVTDLALPFSRGGAKVEPFLTDVELFVLLAAAFLHDVGMYTTFDHYYAEPLKIRELHGRLSRRTLTREAQLVFPTLSPSEVHLVALLCSYHQRSAPLSEEEKARPLAAEPPHPPSPPESGAPVFGPQPSLEAELREAQEAGLDCFGLEQTSQDVCPFLLATLLKLLDGCDYQANRNGSIEAVFRHADRNLSHAARSERLVADSKPGTDSLTRAEIERGFFQGSMFHFMRNLLIERTLIAAEPREGRATVLTKPADPDEVTEMCRLLVLPPEAAVGPGDDTLTRFNHIMGLLTSYQRQPLQTVAEALGLDPQHSKLEAWQVDECADDRRTVHFLVAQKYIEGELNAVCSALQSPTCTTEYAYCGVCANQANCTLKHRRLPALTDAEGRWAIRMFGAEGGAPALQGVPSVGVRGRLPASRAGRRGRQGHSRPQDTQRLAAALDRHKQLLIYGPAGRGKTLLGRAAALALAREETRVFWHTIGAEDDPSAELVRSLGDFLALHGDFTLANLVRDERITTRHEAAALRLLGRGRLAGSGRGLVAVIDDFNRLALAARPFFRAVTHLFPCLTCPEGETCRPAAERPWSCASATSRVLLISTKVPGLSFQQPRVGGLPVKTLTAPPVGREDARRIVGEVSRDLGEDTARRALRIWADYGREADAIPVVEAHLAGGWEPRRSLQLIGEDLADGFASGFGAEALGGRAEAELLSLVGLLNGVLAADEAQEVLGLRQRPTEAQGDDPTDEGPLQRVIDRALVKERAGQLSAHPAWVAGRRRSRWVDRVTGDPWPALVRYVALGRRPAEGLRRRWSLLARYLPELAALRRLPGGPHHRVDPLEHTFRVLEGLPEASAQLGYHLAAGPAVLAEHLVQEIPGRGSWPALTRGQLLRVAGLFHDIGKAPTCAGENETVTFHGHETAGAELWAALAQRHGLPPAQTEHVERLIRLHLRPLALFGAPDRSAKAVRGLVTDAGDALPDLLLLFRSDLTADPLEPVDAGAVLSFVTALSAEAKALRAASAAEAPAITGDELLAAGLAPGPGFGAALKAAQAAARADPALDREALLRVAKEAYSIGTKTQN